MSKLSILEIPRKGPARAWSADDKDDFITKCCDTYQSNDLSEFGSEPYSDSPEAFDFWVEVASHDLQHLFVLTEQESIEYINNRQQGWIELSEL